MGSLKAHFLDQRTTVLQKCSFTLLAPKFQCWIWSLQGAWPQGGRTATFLAEKASGLFVQVITIHNVALDDVTIMRSFQRPLGHVLFKDTMNSNPFKETIPLFKDHLVMS